MYDQFKGSDTDLNIVISTKEPKDKKHGTMWIENTPRIDYSFLRKSKSNTGMNIRQFILTNLGKMLTLIGILLFLFRGMEPISTAMAVILVSLICVPVFLMAIYSSYEDNVNPVVRRLSRPDVIIGLLVIVFYIGCAAGLLNYVM